MPKDWIKARTKDHYYKKAKIDGYSSRAAYKLLELKKFGIFNNVQIVIDLCSHPGSWIEVLMKEISKLKMIIAIDLQSLRLNEDPKIKFIRGDMSNQRVQDKIKEFLEDRKADLVVSDCSQKLSGDKYLDHNKQLFLADKSLDIALRYLKHTGNAVIKYFQGVNDRELFEKANENFLKVKSIKPKASLKNSSEMYILCLGKN